MQDVATVAAAGGGVQAPFDHFRGECKPCAYFWHKQDGCRWGDQCEFCHLCDRDAIKRQKKMKRQRMKAQAHSFGIGGPRANLAPEAAERPMKVNIKQDMAVPLRVEVGPLPGLKTRSYLPLEQYMTYTGDLDSASSQDQFDNDEPATIDHGFKPPGGELLKKGFDLGQADPVHVLRCQDIFPELQWGSFGLSAAAGPPCGPKARA